MKYLYRKKPFFWSKTGDYGCSTHKGRIGWSFLCDLMIKNQKQNQCFEFYSVSCFLPTCFHVFTWRLSKEKNLIYQTLKSFGFCISIVFVLCIRSLHLPIAILVPCRTVNVNVKFQLREIQRSMTVCKFLHLVLCDANVLQTLWPGTLQNHAKYGWQNNFVLVPILLLKLAAFQGLSLRISIYCNIYLSTKIFLI